MGAENTLDLCDPKMRILKRKSDFSVIPKIIITVGRMSDLPTVWFSELICFFENSLVLFSCRLALRNDPYNTLNRTKEDAHFSLLSNA